jgi:hypothetical protein
MIMANQLGTRLRYAIIRYQWKNNFVRCEGDYIVVAFWMHCGKCREEIPRLIRYTVQNGKNVRIYAVMVK